MNKITDFNIKINKENILKTLKCDKNSPVYEHIKHELDRLLPAVQCLIKPEAYVSFKLDRAYCVLSAGKEISDYSKRLFDMGEALDGLIVNAVADDYIFSMDAELAEFIKAKCAGMSKGISKRLEAPADIELQAQKEIIDACYPCSVTLTEGFMLNPMKSMAYILELTDDAEIFNAQHDCSKCRCADCPRRSAPFKGEYSVLSDYDFEIPKANNGLTACIDIGTTTLVFQLIENGNVVKEHREINLQRRFGLDVLSRIEASNRGRDKELKQIISYQLKRGIESLTSDKIEKIIIAANTTMIYLLMGYSCEELGQYPFYASHTDTLQFNENDTEVTIIGGFSAFVGGDITSGLYMTDFDLSDKVNLFIDLGTNGEMAIGNKDKIITASTAAGPAFEGGKISCGLGSVDGAVCGIDIKSGNIETINDKPPAGICGTGIVDLTANLLESGIIDKTGLLTEKYFNSGYPVTDKIRFTQKDIREIQTAKSAVRAGIEILMARYGVKANDINTLYIAGGFGRGLKVDSASKIGLIPQSLSDKVKFIGNSALGGAVKYAVNDGYSRIENMRKINNEITLGNDELFNELYIRHIDF